MDALELFLYCHASLHAGIEEVVDGVDEEGVRQRPHPKLNSLAWLIWHLARTEDIAVNRIVADRAQVLIEEDWVPRLGVSREDVGTAMVDEALTDLGDRVDVPNLRLYRHAVAERTRETVRALGPDVLGEDVDPAHLRRVVFDEGMFEGYRPAEAAFAPRPKGTWLGSHVIVHGHRHLGEARVTRSLLGHRVYP